MDIGEMIFMANKAGFLHFEGEYHINFSFEIHFEKGKEDAREEIVITKYVEGGNVLFDLIVSICKEPMIAETKLNVEEFTKTFYSALMTFTIKTFTERMNICKEMKCKLNPDKNQRN